MEKEKNTKIKNQFKKSIDLMSGNWLGEESLKEHIKDLNDEIKILNMEISHLEWVIKNKKTNQTYLNIKQLTDEKTLNEMSKKDLINKFVDLEIKIQELELDNRDLINGVEWESKD